MLWTLMILVTNAKPVMIDTAERIKSFFDINVFCFPHHRATAMPALPEFWRFDNIFWPRFLKRNFPKGGANLRACSKQKRPALLPAWFKMGRFIELSTGEAGAQ